MLSGFGCFSPCSPEIPNIFSHLLEKRNFLPFDLTELFHSCIIYINILGAWANPFCCFDDIPNIYLRAPIANMRLNNVQR